MVCVTVCFELMYEFYFTSSKYTLEKCCWIFGGRLEPINDTPFISKENDDLGYLNACVDFTFTLVTCTALSRPFLPPSQKAQTYIHLDIIFRFRLIFRRWLLRSQKENKNLCLVLPPSTTHLKPQGQSNKLTTYMFRETTLHLTFIFLPVEMWELAPFNHSISVCTVQTGIITWGAS